MLGIGFQELLLIAVVAVVVVGPKKLPELAKSLGKGIQEFKKATEGIRSSLNENDTFKDLQGIKDSVKETVSSLKPAGLLDLEGKPAAPPTPAPELKKFAVPAPDAPEAAQPLLEPQKPVENLEGRLVLMDAIIGESRPAPAPAAAEAAAPAGEPAAASSPAPGKTNA